jgi:choline dehydrogenase-like flavoprotein
MKLQPKLRFKPEERERHSSGVAGSFSFTSKLQENIGNIKMLVRAAAAGRAHSNWRKLPSDVRALGAAFLPIVLRYLRHRRILALFEGGLALNAQIEQLPIARSRITLVDDAPQPSGLFRAAVDWQVDGREIETLRAFAEQCDRYLQRRGIARLRIDERILAGDRDFLTSFMDTYHQCGGMRMSAQAADGVVDPACRVWKTDNVHVAGACVFPTSGSANCTLTALALAARLAASLAGSHGRADTAAR